MSSLHGERIQQMRFAVPQSIHDRVENLGRDLNPLLSTPELPSINNSIYNLLDKSLDPLVL